MKVTFLRFQSFFKCVNLLDFLSYMFVNCIFFGFWTAEKQI